MLINQLPKVKSTSTQTALFAVQADGRTAVVELRNKAWNTLKIAATTYPQWVAAIGGKLGEAIESGFRLGQPMVQVFERKAKPETVASTHPEICSVGIENARITRPVIGYAKLDLKGKP